MFVDQRQQSLHALSDPLYVTRFPFDSFFKEHERFEQRAARGVKVMQAAVPGMAVAFY